LEALHLSVSNLIYLNSEGYPCLLLYLLSFKSVAIDRLPRKAGAKAS
jgi:hypothetical protein